jgi:AbrB family looped-hinge helix DNA binding protein
MKNGKTYLTTMNAQTKLSAKGQVVIPKDVRDRLHWAQGQALEVIETPEGVLLKQPYPKKTLTIEQALARIRARVQYDGPPLTIEDMNEAVSEIFRDSQDDRF